MPRDATPLAVADRLHAAAIRLLRGVRAVDSDLGISSARLSALSVVVYAGPLAVGELAAAEQVKAPTMTRIVAALEDEGLVERRRDAADRRVVRVAATAAGRRVLERGRRRRIEQLAAGLAGLSRRELATLDAAADLLLRQLGGGSTAPPPVPDEPAGPRR